MANIVVFGVFGVFAAVLAVGLVRGEGCGGGSASQQIAITVYEDIDSGSKTLLLDNRIETDGDYFHLRIANQTIPRLCSNFVVISNELSLFQLVNSSVRDILPGAFNITPTLALIRIARNPLTSIRKHVFNAVAVKELDLSENRIVRIDPEAFNNITQLEIVKLQNNQIKEISSDWFANSPHVYKLDIVYNDVTAVPAGAFRNMARTRPLHLRLSANRITDLSPAALDGHHCVEMLKINGNRLAALPGALFTNRTIKHLQVNANRLTCFPEELFRAAPAAAVDTLEFIDNLPFRCDCLRRVRQFASDTGVNVLYPSVICEDRAREVNVVYNYNKTYEIPLLPPTVDVDVYVDSKTTNH